MPDEQYYLRWRGVKSGPYPADEIREMLEMRQITLLHEASEDGVHWVQVGSLGLVAPSPPPLPLRPSAPALADDGEDMGSFAETLAEGTAEGEASPPEMPEPGQAWAASAASERGRAAFPQARDVSATLTLAALWLALAGIVVPACGAAGLVCGIVALAFLDAGKTKAGKNKAVAAIVVGAANTLLDPLKVALVLRLFRN